MNDDLARIASLDASQQAAHQRLSTSQTWIPLPDHGHIQVAGNDRARFLHNLCTNDVIRLTSGTGCEAFATNVQGKTVGHLGIAACDAYLSVEVRDGATTQLIAHWERYHITEDVQLIDRSGDWMSIVIAGPTAPDWLQTTMSLALEADHANGLARLNDIELFVRRIPWLAVPAYLATVERSAAAALFDELTAHLGPAADETVFHVARVEHRYPWFGWDITDRNLPQEVDRTSQAISFRKGCYLGQETVARLDALGHVNRLLTQFHIDSRDVPHPHTAIVDEQQTVGEITSTAYSPLHGHAVAMGYLRCSHRQAARRLTLATGERVVVMLDEQSAAT